MNNVYVVYIGINCSNYFSNKNIEWTTKFAAGKSIKEILKYYIDKNDIPYDLLSTNMDDIKFSCRDGTLIEIEKMN